MHTFESTYFLIDDRKPIYVILQYSIYLQVNDFHFQLGSALVKGDICAYLPEFVLAARLVGIVGRTDVGGIEMVQGFEGNSVGEITAV